jgi:hypothetical protein
VLCGFSYIELRDDIVGAVEVRPETGKSLVLAMPDEIKFDFIPEGVGMVRTAYLKFSPTLKDNEIRFTNVNKTLELRMFLI